jgi:hypothetical protein
MGFLSRLFGKKRDSSESGDSQALHFYVACDKCGEKIHVRASRRTDVSLEYPDESPRGIPTLHKEILGSQCQNLMYLHVTFDGAYNVVESRSERCAVITRAQYEQA